MFYHNVRKDRFIMICERCDVKRFIFPYVRGIFLKLRGERGGGIKNGVRGGSVYGNFISFFLCTMFVYHSHIFV